MATGLPRMFQADDRLVAHAAFTARAATLEGKTDRALVILEKGLEDARGVEPTREVSRVAADDEWDGTAQRGDSPAGTRDTDFSQRGLSTPADWGLVSRAT